MVRFLPGKLYKPVRDRSFPNENGLRNNLFYKPGQHLDNPSILKEDCVMLVLETLYTQRYKISMKKGMEKTLTIYMWHMKVIIDEQMGYVTQWEDQWEEIID